MHNSKLLQSLSFQNGTGFSDFSPTAKECARGFRAARHFLPPQLFFLSFFSNPPKFCPNLSGKLPKSVCSFSRILHRRFSCPSTSNQNPERSKGDRSNNGSAHKFKHTEIGEEAIAMAVQTLDGLLPHPLLRRVSPRVTVQSAGEQPQCHRTCHSCLWERARTVFPFVTTNFKDNRFLSPSSKNKQISTNFVTVSSTKCFWEGFGKFCFSSANSTSFTNFGNFPGKIRQFFKIIFKKKPCPSKVFLSIL